MNYNLLEIDFNNVSIYDDLSIVDNLEIIKPIDGNTIFDLLDHKIENTIYDVGLDKFLLSKNKINGNEFKFIYANYDKYYNEGKSHTKENIEFTFNYVYNKLKGAIIMCDNMIVVNGIETDALSILLNLYEKEGIEDYKYLNDFFEYVKSKKFELKK